MKNFGSQNYKERHIPIYSRYFLIIIIEKLFFNGLNDHRQKKKIISCNLIMESFDFMNYAQFDENLIIRFTIEGSFIFPEIK